jgi:ABC-type polysaccharide/polyol phosphate export permease
MTLSLIFIFLSGIANFAMHRALIESRDPIIQASVLPVQRVMGRYTSYAFEFVLLLMAMLFSQSWPIAMLLLYGLYTMINVIVFALLTNRPR